MQEIWHGDCLDLMPKIPDRSVGLVVTDLPYELTSRNVCDKIIPFEKLWPHWLRILKDNGVVALTAIQPFSSMVINSNLKMFKYEWIWRKQQGTGFLNAKKQPLRNHESILVFYNSQPTYNPQFTEGKPYICKKGSETTNYGKHGLVTTISDGKRYPLTVLDFKNDKEKLHPTQKPISLGEYLIKTYTNERDLILDNCCGSGSFLVAAINTNRQFIGIEKEEKYYEIARNRVKQSLETKSSSQIMLL